MVDKLLSYKDLELTTTNIIYQDMIKNLTFFIIEEYFLYSELMRMLHSSY